MTGEPRRLVLFDLDNCLYSKNRGIVSEMGDKIQAYFAHSLELSEKEAKELHRDYLVNYGLALKGLIKHHKIDPMHYNRFVDDSLPLENLLHDDKELQQMLSRIDQSRYRMWIVTNAYIKHATRVLKILGVERFFEGITYCDYTQTSRGETLICKPELAFYQKAMKDAGASSDAGADCYFVDDSLVNVQGAIDAGIGRCFHMEEDAPIVGEGATSWETIDYHGGQYTKIRSLMALPMVAPELFMTNHS